MQKIGVVFLGLSLLLAGAVEAKKNEPPPQPERAALEKQRQQIVARNLTLSEAEGKKFWPVYRAYRAEKNDLLGQRQSLLKEYRARVATMDDAKALKLLRRVEKLREMEAELRRIYVDRFAKVLPTRTLFRLYQIENRLEAIARFEATRTIQLQR